MFLSFDEKKDEPIFKIRLRHYQRFDTLVKECAKLKSAVNESNVFTKDQLKGIKSRYLSLRKAFKKWEYLGEYTDPVFVKEYVNGAPLPQMEKNSFGPNVIQPKGLQAIDELLYSKDAKNSKKELSQLVNALYDEISKHNLRTIYDRDVFVASRQALVRVYTLGLTGFDTPGSLNGIDDAKVLLTAMRGDILHYKEYVAVKSLVQEIDLLMAGFTEFLRVNNNFNTLDRLKLLIDFVNPLYTKLFELHSTLGYEFPEEYVTAPQPLNYKSKGLFESDFLKAEYYNRVPKIYNTTASVALGKTLFFDPILSENNERACASCHAPEKGFTDQLQKSVAFGKEGYLKRNSPTLLNAIYSEKYFHDLRARSFEDQTEHVITNPQEFNTTLLQLVQKLNKSEEYKMQFKKTYGYPEEEISLKYIQFSISAYLTTLVSHNSLFDKYVRGEVKTLHPEIKEGYNLFMGKAACGTCHYAPLFNGTVPPYFKESESEVLGLPQDPYAKKLQLDPDEGRGNSLLKDRVEFYLYSFKTPTVRNVELTAPYMHNGAYKTLEDVMDFYNKGGGLGLKIDVPGQTLSGDELKLNKKEIKSIIAFMKALTDTSGLTSIPSRLPVFENNPEWNKRIIGGVY